MWHLKQREKLSLFGAVVHGKGGGGSAPAPQPTTSTVNQSSLPAYAEPYFNDLLTRTQGETEKDYTPYTGQRIAGFAGDTTTAFGDIRKNAAAGNAGIDQGMSTTAANLNTQGGQFGAQQASDYMNPYISNVLDTTEDRMAKRFQEQQGARDADAVSKGAFGGSRAAIVTGQAQRDMNDQMAQMEAQQYAQAFNNAEGQFNADRAARLQATGMNLQGAGQLAQLDQMDNSVDLQNANSLMQTGAMQQTQDQNQLTTAYQDFVNQRDFPRQQLNFYSSILRGVPISAQSETTQYAAPQNPLNQMMGLGVAGLGAYKALGGGA